MKLQRLTFTLLISLTVFVLIYYEVFNFKNYFNQKVIIKSTDGFMSFINRYCKDEWVKNSYSCLRKLSGHEWLTTTSDLYLFHLIMDLKYDMQLVELTLASYLVTQNLNQTKMILWIHEYMTNSTVTIKLKQTFKYYFEINAFEIKIINMSQLVDNDVYRPYKDKCLDAYKNEPAELSDFLRFLILFNYGGIYVDGKLSYDSNIF